MGSIENGVSAVAADGGLHVEWKGSRDVLSNMVATSHLWLVKFKFKWFKVKENLEHILKELQDATFKIEEEQIENVLKQLNSTINVGIKQICPCAFIDGL